MAELLACWKCHQPVYANAYCKNCGASYDLPTKPMVVLQWSILIGVVVWFLFTDRRALAITALLGVFGYIFFTLGRKYEWWSQQQTH